MRFPLKMKLASLIGAAMLTVVAVTPAFAGSVNLYSSSCVGAGGSSMAQPTGLSYTSGCSDYQRYDYPGWSGSYGYIDGTPTWRQSDIAFAGPSGTTHVNSIHNLCTSTYGSCNGYVPTSS